ncbi:MFS transporter [Euzebya rosea]|uniref:MFS transporter n=1 Tax=Euzebya rosea TaxID=2052804 RepID=UPI0013009E3D|nr:MFS transporter [Euzebya rosea]
MAAPPADDHPSTPDTGAPRVYGWLHPSVVVAAVFSAYAGFAQFSATAALPDIAAAFGTVTEGAEGSITAQAGLSGTVLGLGLGVIRLASLAALPLSRQADRHGRRVVLLATTAVALVLTAASAGMPTFWGFVALLALARPLMSATNAVAGVIASEEVATVDRSKAIALVTVGYGTGAGIPVVLRGITDGEIGFRTLFLIAVPLLLTLPLVSRLVTEPDRSARLVEADAATSKRLGRVPAELRGRLVLLCTLTFFVAFLTGPVNTYLFLYAEQVAGVSPGTLAVVIPFAAILGAAGLAIGVRLADRYGRIPTAMWTKVGLAACGVLTYSAGAWGALVGYVLSLFIGSSYAPAVGATAAEIFPTSIRATAAGWITACTTVGAVVGLLLFGWVADVSGSFSVASWVVSVPCAISMIGYRFLPETKGLELEESAPEVA